MRKFFLPVVAILALGACDVVDDTRSPAEMQLDNFATPEAAAFVAAIEAGCFPISETLSTCVDIPQSAVAHDVQWYAIVDGIRYDLAMVEGYTYEGGWYAAAGWVTENDGVVAYSTLGSDSVTVIVGGIEHTFAVVGGTYGVTIKDGNLVLNDGVTEYTLDGKKLVFNYPILEKIVERFKKSVLNDAKRQEAIISYDIDEYDERFLRHLALGYTKEMIANLRGMPFGVKSLEKRQNDLVGRLFPPSERVGVNATRLVVRALELRILNIDNLEADDE